MNKLFKKKAVWIVILGGLAAIACFFLLYQNLMANYAEETARPLEKALVKVAGATKTGSGGDSGRGPDNQTPWYSASFRVGMNKEETVSLMQKVAKENGYELNHASATNKGPLEFVVADQYLDNWYFDATSKTADFPNVPKEPVQLTMAVNYEGDAVGGADLEHSVIRLEVRLPSFK